MAGAGLGVRAIEVAVFSPFAAMSNKKFYAVRVGRNTGVFDSWRDCEAQVKRYPGAVFKGFQSHSEADSFMSGNGGRMMSGASCSGHSSSLVSSVRESYSGNFVGGANRQYSTRSRARSGGLVDDDRSNNRRDRILPASSRGLADSSSYSARDNRMLLPASSSASRPVVHVDGSCFGNGFKGAVAGIGVYWGHDNPHNVSESLPGRSTNQRAELIAACRAIESGVQQGHSAIEIRTDSKYTIQAATEWIKSWKNKGWKTVAHNDVKNREEMELLDNLCGRMDITWTHVNAHAGIPGNEAADALAKAGAMKN